MSDRIFIKKAFATFSSGTFLSRGVGLARDIVLAAFFKNWETDVWITAFRIPNLLRRLLAENTVTMSVVPVLTDSLKEGKEKTQRVINSIFTVFLGVLILAATVGIILSPQIINLIVPSFSEIPGKMELTIRLTRIMFPYIILIGITAFFMGILNNVGHFFAPSIHPIFLNLSIIILASVASLFEPRVTALALAVIIGGALQMLVHVPFLKKYNFIPKLTLNFEKKELLEVGKLFLPSLLAVSVVPITVMINTYFASIVGDGGISYLFWADRLVQLPLGIFAVGLGTAILPILSRASGDSVRLTNNYSYAFKICTLILLPATAGLMALSTPVVKVIFQHGNFIWNDTVNTSTTLFFLAISLYPAGIIRITVPLFYSMKDSLRPAIFSFVALIVNTVICFLTVYTLGMKGLAIAISSASLVNALMLLIYFSIRHTKLKLANLTFILKIIVISAVTYLSSHGVSSMRDWRVEDSLVNDISYLLLAVACGLVCFVVSSHVLGMRKEISHS